MCIGGRQPQQKIALGEDGGGKQTGKREGGREEEKEGEGGVEGAGGRACARTIERGRGALAVRRAGAAANPNP